MISENMILEGYEAGIIKIIDSPHDDGAVCKIGDNWFYFGGQTAEESTAADYIANVPKEDIAEEIYSVLDEFQTEFPDEYLYYEFYLREFGIV